MGTLLPTWRCGFSFLTLIWLKLFVQEVVSVSNPEWVQDRQNPAFCYDPNLSCGPPFWPGTCTSGGRQSPIDIQSNSYKIFKKFSYFTLNPAYSVAQPIFFARNTGHSFQIQFDGATSPTSAGLQFTDGGSPTKGNTFLFSQLHFHWGSEHTLNGVRYPLEMHMVHHNAKYATLMDAMRAVNDPQAVAVLAVLFQVGFANPAMTPIVDVVQLSLHEDPVFTSYQKVINVENLLPLKLHYVRYMGSLTTPPCTENVVWTVFTTPVSISLPQLMSFQQVLDPDGLLYMNFRPTQPLNGRSLTWFKVPGIKRILTVTKQGLVQIGGGGSIFSLLSNALKYLGNQFFWNLSLLVGQFGNVFNLLFPLFNPYFFVI